MQRNCWKKKIGLNENCKMISTECSDCTDADSSKRMTEYWLENIIRIVLKMVLIKKEKNSLIAPLTTTQFARYPTRRKLNDTYYLLDLLSRYLLQFSLLLNLHRLSRTALVSQRKWNVPIETTTSAPHPLKKRWLHDKKNVQIDER